MRQVLLNLLNNATSFTETGEITIHATTDDERGGVCVQDTGVEIDSAVLQEIFDPFRQLDMLTPVMDKPICICPHPPTPSPRCGEGE